ncbi:MAG: hypothetical protein VX835_01445 [Pseudomonadota bacterium]|nr:hypothetical protein [Pseudomonadota bacterium]
MAEILKSHLADEINQINDADVLFSFIKEEVNKAKDQQQLNVLLNVLMLKAKDNEEKSLQIAIDASIKLIDKRYQSLPCKNIHYCRENMAYGLFCFVGSLLILIALINPAGLIIGSAYVLLGLSIAFIGKNFIQHFGTTDLFNQPIELSKLLLSIAVTTEVVFYNFTEFFESNFDPFETFNFLASFVGILSICLSIYIIFLAYKSFKNLKTYEAYNNYFKQMIELDNNFIQVDQLKSGNINSLLENIQTDLTLEKQEALIALMKVPEKLTLEKLQEIMNKQDAQNIFKAVTEKIKFEAFRENNQDDAQFINENFNSINGLVSVINEQTNSTKLMLYLRGIAGAISDDSHAQKPSKELSEHCLGKIKELFQDDNEAITDDNLFKLYQLIEIETKLKQINQPTFKQIPVRLYLDAFLIGSSLTIHILIGTGLLTGAAISILFWPLFSCALAGIIVFTFNEARDVKKKNMIIGISSTYIAFIMMVIIFSTVVGAIAFNPFFLGLGIPIVFVMAVLLKRFVTKKQTEEVNNLEAKLKNLLDEANEQPDTHGLHPDLTDENATRASILTHIESTTDTQINEEDKVKTIPNEDDILDKNIPHEEIQPTLNDIAPEQTDVTTGDESNLTETSSSNENKTEEHATIHPSEAQSDHDNTSVEDNTSNDNTSDEDDASNDSSSVDSAPEQQSTDKKENLFDDMALTKDVPTPIDQNHDDEEGEGEGTDDEDKDGEGERRGGLKP